MQRLLSEKEAEQIDARFHDNGLLLTCREVWPVRQEKVTSVVARAADVFCEAAWLTDELMDADRDTDVLNRALGLWTDVTLHIARWGSGVSLNDRYIIVSTVFHIVATAFALHWDSYYCDQLRDALLEAENEKRGEPEDLHHLQEQQRAQEKLLEAVVSCSDMLNEWVNDYIDNPEQWLTDEIDLALNPPVCLKAVKPESRKADMRTIVRERKSWKDEVITHSFIYVTKSMPTDEKNRRLSLAFNLLNKRFIDHTETTTFINVFTGVETSEYIAWRGSIVELHYFIESLITRGVITWNLPAPGKWQIVCARFRLIRNVTVGADDTGSKQKSKIIDELKPAQFNKIPKNAKLTQHSVLDKIISLLVEESDATRINREINDMFAQMEGFEKEHQKGQKQVHEIDY